MFSTQTSKDLKSVRDHHQMAFFNPILSVGNIILHIYIYTYICVHVFSIKYILYTICIHNIRSIIYLGIIEI